MLAELAAAEIAKIAFEAVIGKLTEGAMDKGVELWQKIKQKLQKEPQQLNIQEVKGNLNLGIPPE